MFLIIQLNVMNSSITILHLAHTIVGHYTDFIFLSFDEQLCKSYMTYERQMNFAFHIMWKYF